MAICSAQSGHLRVVGSLRNQPLIDQKRALVSRGSRRQAVQKAASCSASVRVAPSLARAISSARLRICIRLSLFCTRAAGVLACQAARIAASGRPAASNCRALSMSAWAMAPQ